MIRKQKKNSKYKNMREERLALEHRKEYEVPSGRKYRLDAHCHTLACGHAYNTLLEVVYAAQDAGLEMICLTEHGPEMPGSVTDMFFSNLASIPAEINGVRILKGMEANIMNSDGLLDVSEMIRPKLEILSASLHTPCFPPASMTENTSAVLGAIADPDVDFLCHLGNPQYPLDYEAVVQEAAKHDKMIEINNGSFYIRKGSKDNCVALAKLCAKYEVPVILGTDTHFCTDIGKFPYADRALIEAGVPDELIVNLDIRRLTDRLEAKGKKLGLSKKDGAEKLFSF